jgi:hypothetical protein
MRKKSSIVEISKFSLVVIALGAMLPALNTRAHAAAAPASAPAVAAKVEKVIEIPRSVFVQPLTREEGKDPFFPQSLRPYARQPVLVPIPLTNVPPPVVNVDLKLKGISGTAEKPLAIINNVTLTEGEERDVMTNTGKQRIKCLQIKGEVVLVQIGIERRELRLPSGNSNLIATP